MPYLPVKSSRASRLTNCAHDQPHSFLVVENDLHEYFYQPVAGQLRIAPFLLLSNARHTPFAVSIGRCAAMSNVIPLRPDPANWRAGCSFRLIAFIRKRKRLREETVQILSLVSFARLSGLAVYGGAAVVQKPSLPFMNCTDACRSVCVKQAGRPVSQTNCYDTTHAINGRRELERIK